MEQISNIGRLLPNAANYKLFFLQCVRSYLAEPTSLVSSTSRRVTNINKSATASRRIDDTGWKRRHFRSSTGSSFQYGDCIVHKRHYSTGVIKSPFPDLKIPENVSLPHFLLSEFPKYGDQIAMVNGLTGEEVSYSQLQTMIVKTTSSLVKMGLRHGSIVTMFGFNSIEYVVAFIAITATGATVSTVNPAYTAEELARAIQLVGSTSLFFSPEITNTVAEALKVCPRVVNTFALGMAVGYRPSSSLLDNDMSCFLDNLDVRPKTDVAVIPFSSGTTGMPKGVMLTHYNLLANILQSRSEHVFNYVSGHDVLVAVLPIFHIYAQVMVFLSGLASGTKIIILPKFDPKIYLEVVQKYRATFLHIVPPLMLFLAKHPMVDQYDFSSVATMMSGAAPLGAETIEQVRERLKKDIDIRQGYGLTETSPITHLTPAKSGKYHVVGAAVQNTEFKIVCVDSRKSLGKDNKGELLVRGPQVMMGYFQNEQATAETIVDGWLHTGDIGYYDDDGHVAIVDRMKELIKVKGLQVAPAELEALLVTHKAVQDAAVLGIPNERLGEAPVAFIVLKPDFKPTDEMARQLQQFVAENVAPYKRLVGGIEFRSEIPKAASGKILRRVLKKELESKSPQK